MPRFLDLTGQRFGRLVVLERAGSQSGHACWLCKCDCGNKISVFASNLKKGTTQSCGCLRKEKTSQRRRRHGEKKLRLYNVWSMMKKRCNNPNATFYKDYGGRGITVCEEWENSFEAFRDWALSNGYNDALTIDRINTNKGYTPENCRWVCMKEQSNNKRNNLYLSFNGETHTLSEWSEIKRIGYMTLKTRIRRGWTVERALTEQVYKKT